MKKPEKSNRVSLNNNNIISTRKRYITPYVIDKEKKARNTRNLQNWENNKTMTVKDNSMKDNDKQRYDKQENDEDNDVHVIHEYKYINSITKSI